VDCPLELLLPHETEERRTEINQGLRNLGTDPSEILDFITTFGSQSRFTFPGSIDTHQPVRIALPITPENVGKNNTGIFYFQRDGHPRVLKVLGQVPDPIRLAGLRKGALKMEIGDPDRLSLMRTARELQGSALGEGEGAPVIQRFGTFDYKGKTYYAVEMDELFPGQRRVSLKEAIRGDDVPFDPLTKKHPTTGEPVPQQMADQFLKALLKNKNPNDADFMVSETGEVRWIDTAAWNQIDWRNPQMPTHKKGGLGFSLSSFLEIFSKKSPTQARVFYDNLRQRIAQAPLTVRERERLLDELFNPQNQIKYSNAQAFHNYRRNIGL